MKTNKIKHVLALISVCTVLMLQSCSLSDLFGMAGITSQNADISTAQTPVTTTEPQYVPVPERPDIDSLDLDQYLSVEYKGIEIETNYQKREITDEVIDGEINDVLIYYGYYDLVTDRACAQGDMLEFEFTGYMDGEAFEGGHSDKSTILLDEENSGFIPGFAAGIIGHNCGEEFEINVTFPEGYHDMGGKAAVFKIKIHGIIKPALTDENAAKIVDSCKTVAELRAYLRDYLTTAEESQLYSSVRNNIPGALQKKAVFKMDLPALTEYYYAYMVNDYIEQAQYYGISYDEYLVYNGLTDEKIREGAADYAKQELIFEFIEKKENASLTDQEYTDYLNQIIESYRQQGYSINAEAIENTYGKDYLFEQAQYEKILDIVYKNAVIVYKPAETAE